MQICTFFHDGILMHVSKQYLCIIWQAKKIKINFALQYWDNIVEDVNHIIQQFQYDSRIFAKFYCAYCTRTT